MCHNAVTYRLSIVTRLSHSFSQTNLLKATDDHHLRNMSISLNVFYSVTRWSPVVVSDNEKHEFTQITLLFILGIRFRGVVWRLESHPLPVIDLLKELQQGTSYHRHSKHSSEMLADIALSGITSRQLIIMTNIISQLPYHCAQSLQSSTTLPLFQSLTKTCFKHFTHIYTQWSSVTE